TVRAVPGCAPRSRTNTCLEARCEADATSAAAIPSIFPARTTQAGDRAGWRECGHCTGRKGRTTSRRTNECVANTGAEHACGALAARLIVESMKGHESIAASAA